MHRSTRRAITVLLLAFASGTGTAGAQPPAPADSAVTQNTVPTLTNYNSFATIMNLARGAVRLVAVITPSSPDAEAGLDVIASILDDISSKRLRAFVILSRASEEDTQVRALSLAARHRDRRIVYIWDPEASIATAMGPVVGIGSALAFETYFLFDTDATFTQTPPPPALWMDLSPYIDGTPLEAAPLGERADLLVRAVEHKAAQASQGP